MKNIPLSDIYMVYLARSEGIVFSALGRPLFPLIHSGACRCRRCAVDKLCALCPHYGLLSMPAFMLQNVTQSFFVTAEKPKLGLGVVVTPRGCTPIWFSTFLLVGVFSFVLGRISQQSP